MQKKERYQSFVNYFSKNMPLPETELHYENPFQLLIAVILSAQCTDKRINMVTPALFRDFPTPMHLAHSDADQVFPYIRSVSYPNNKTKHLLGMGKMLVEEFGGEIPSSFNELIKLPGVGRKTANVITSVVWNQPNMAVDTHVFRVSKRIGLVPQNVKSPLEVEKQLLHHLPREVVHKAHHWLILHGRYVCLARRPKCEECQITDFCRYFEKNHLKIAIQNKSQEKRSF
ncbi:MAG: endonuclease III [Cyclobacteriaceae bacterium]